MGLANAVVYNFVKLKLNQANKLIDFSEVEAANYPDRSIAILITDLPGDNIGFGFNGKDKKLVMYDTIPDPTIKVKCTKKVFLAAIDGKLDLNDLFYGALAEVEGKALMRDKIILEKGLAAFKKAGFTKF